MFNMRDKYLNILWGHYSQQLRETKRYVPQKCSNLENKLLVLIIYISKSVIIRVLCYVVGFVMVDDLWLKLPSHVIVAWRHLNKAERIWFASISIQDLRPLCAQYICHTSPTQGSESCRRQNSNNLVFIHYNLKTCTCNVCEFVRAEVLFISNISSKNFPLRGSPILIEYLNRLSIKQCYRVKVIHK